MDFIDLSDKQCPQGHTTLVLHSQYYEVFEVLCTTCDIVYYEHDLVLRPAKQQEQPTDDSTS